MAVDETLDALIADLTAFWRQRASKYETLLRELAESGGRICEDDERLYVEAEADLKSFLEERGWRVVDDTPQGEFDLGLAAVLVNERYHVEIALEEGNALCGTLWRDVLEQAGDLYVYVFDEQIGREVLIY